MIYEKPGEDEPIRQGDIFVGIPRADLSLENVPVIRNHGMEDCRWADLAASEEPVEVIVRMRSVAAIVASQDCDAAHAPDITLCEIRDFPDVERKCRDTVSAKSWVAIITQHARVNQKWFYLPPDPSIGFRGRMGVDFLVTIRLSRTDLEALRHLRTSRLNPMAVQHFRERLSEFYRRYPVDEWYALTREELTEYQRDHPDAAPFPWQSAASEPGQQGH